MTKLQDVECELTEETKSSRRHGSKRRTRAAEVHNQSERVRSYDTCNLILLNMIACRWIVLMVLRVIDHVEKKGPDQ